MHWKVIMRFLTDQCVFMLMEYLNSWSYERVCTAFSYEYSNSSLRPKSTISRLAQKLITPDSVLDKPKERVRTVRTSTNAQRVWDSVPNNPRLLTRQGSRALNIFYTSTQRILHQLKMCLYRFSIVQELKLPDHARRVTFCHWILHLTHLGHDISMFDNFFYSDEAWFYLNGFINAQNYRIWS